MFTAVLNQKSTIIIKQKITKHNAVGINYDYITFQTNINNHISLYLILQSNDRVGMYLHLNMISIIQVISKSKNKSQDHKN